MLVVGGRGHLRRWGSEAGFLHWGMLYNEHLISTHSNHMKNQITYFIYPRHRVHDLKISFYLSKSYLTRSSGTVALASSRTVHASLHARPEISISDSRHIEQNQGTALVFHQ